MSENSGGKEEEMKEKNVKSRANPDPLGVIVLRCRSKRVNAL
jgi:hypothetical protein